MPPDALHADSLKPSDQGREALRYLATQCTERRLVHDLIVADAERWPFLTSAQRRKAFERALRRAGAVCPWALDKGRIRDAAQALGVSWSQRPADRCLSRSP